MVDRIFSCSQWPNGQKTLPLLGKRRNSGQGAKTPMGKAQALSRSKSIENGTKKVEDISKWNTAKTSEWLNSQPLDKELVKKLDRLDGLLLKELLHLYHRKPQLYLTLLDRWRIDTPIDVLGLGRALQNLPGHSSK